MADKTAISIGIRFNEEEVYLTDEVVINTRLAEMIKGLLIKQADELLNVLRKAQNL